MFLDQYNLYYSELRPVMKVIINFIYFCLTQNSKIKFLLTINIVLVVVIIVVIIAEVVIERAAAGVADNRTGSPRNGMS